MVVAIDIKTNLWNDIIDSLLRNGWHQTYRYDNVDAGIDFDFVILRKDDEEILMGWDNWVEGEIKCTEGRLAEIGYKLKISFKKGDPVNLKPEIIGMYKK